MTNRERASAVVRELAIEVVRQLRGEEPDYEQVTQQLESAISGERNEAELDGQIKTLEWLYAHRRQLDMGLMAIATLTEELARLRAEKAKLR